MGCLYIIPTPIGNLLDITHRALKILNQVDIIASENTIHTYQLLKKFNIKNSLTSLHQHNEIKKTIYLIEKIKQGQNIALVSNAGTPIINDPGFYLVQQCHKQNIQVIPLPGACAIITALIASGLPANKFCFEGFLPSKKNARKTLLKKTSKELRTTIFFESSHRIIESVTDIVDEIGENRNITIARELTKYWESIYYNTSLNILNFLKENKNSCKGEMVILINGYKKTKLDNIKEKHINTLILLKKILPLKQAVLLTSKIHNIKNKLLYKYAINKLIDDKNK
ncbi:16S rRNA (cytidine(1402)-2'-O)-methyltransferase [Buchnera aphidicola]|uniref:16S rRNA (cytidine(1402)-2'-O)-methyltransferase n=1 Tax=Buchnera aphidicola TaxID=9 RepID=UPI003464E10D